MFEDLGEFNPMAAALGIGGAVLSLIVMSKVDVGLIWKIGSFVGTAAVCYFMVDRMSNK